MTRSAEEMESRFTKLLGRQPSELEVARLVRIRDTLGIRENDALWDVLLALEGYDSGFRRYPALLASEVDKSLAKVRAEVGELARTEARRSHQTLAESLAAASDKLAEHKARQALVLSTGWAVVGGALLAGVSLAAGYVLGSGKAPVWALPSSATTPQGLLLHVVLGAPVGWIVIVTAATVVPVWWTKRLSTRPRWWQLAACSALVLAGVVVLASMFA